MSVNNFSGAATLAELDQLGLDLANECRSWTPEERKSFEAQVRKLKRKGDVTVLFAHSTWPLYLECAMCGVDEVFVISKQDPSTGYCFAEKREWTLIEGKNYWPCVTCGTEYTSASNECSDGCAN